MKRLQSCLVEMDPLANEEFLAETRLMRALRHPHIVYFYGCGVDQSSSFLVLEYMARGSLDQILRDTTIDLSWELRIKFAQDASSGMKFLHELDPPRIHRKSLLNLFERSRSLIGSFLPFCCVPDRRSEIAKFACKRKLDSQGK